MASTGASNTQIGFKKPAEEPKKIINLGTFGSRAKKRTSSEVSKVPDPLEKIEKKAKPNGNL